MRVLTSISTAAILESRGLGRSDSARRYLANTVKRLCDPYVPMQQGTLKNIAVISQDGRAVFYDQPYAHYQYHGKIMAGRAPKQYTERPIDYHGAPMRGANWDKRMMADKGDEVLDTFAKHVGGHRK